MSFYKIGFWLAFIVLINSACVVASPPLTMQVGKMPEILDVHEKEIRLSFERLGDGFVTGIEPRFSYGILPRWQLDFGLLNLDHDNNDAIEVLMGTVGAKYGFLAKKRWSGAVLFGVGAGCGGYNGNEDQPSDFLCEDGFAYGSYTGLDFGYRFGRVVGTYLGNRIQFSKAHGLPFSVYGLHILGFQFDVSRKFYLGLETGTGWVANSRNSEAFGQLSINLGFHW